MTYNPSQRRRIERDVPVYSWQSFITECRYLRLDPEAWPELPVYRQRFETLVMVQYARNQMRLHPGMKFTEAMRRAGDHYSLNGDSVRRALARWQSAAPEQSEAA